MQDDQWSSEEGFHDFDAARKARTPVRFKMRGRHYELPGDPPATVVLLLLESDGKVNLSQATGFVRDLVGLERLRQMVADGLTLPDFEELVDWLMVRYKIAAEPGVMTGNLTEEDLALFSSTGPSSNPISSGSTGPTRSS